LALSAYCSHIVVDMGRLDLVVHGDSAATLETRVASLLSLFPVGNVWGTTLIPATTSVNGWVAADDQVDYNAGNAQINIYNTWMRTLPAGFAGFWDVANGITGATPGHYAVSPSPPYTTDGLHPNDGVRLHYLEAGAGKPLVLIHGVSQTAEQFKFQRSKAWEIVTG
jgi:hypothetical protein